MAHRLSGHFQPSFWGHALWFYRLQIWKQRNIHAHCCEALETKPSSCNPHKQSMKKLPHNHCNSLSHRELSNIWLGVKMTVMSFKGQGPKVVTNTISSRNGWHHSQWEEPLVPWEPTKWSSLGSRGWINPTSATWKFGVWIVRTTYTGFRDGERCV